MSKTVETSVALLSAHRLPPDSRLGRMRAGVEQEVAQYRALTGKQNELTTALAEVKRLIAEADVDTVEASQFSDWLASEKLIQQSLDRRLPAIKRASDSFQAAERHFQDAYKAYERLVEELRELERSIPEQAAHDGRPSLSASIRRRQAAARARLSDEDDPRTAQVESIKARIREMVEP